MKDKEVSYCYLTRIYLSAHRCFGAPCVCCPEAYCGCAESQPVVLLGWSSSGGFGRVKPVSTAAKRRDYGL